MIRCKDDTKEAIERVEAWWQCKPADRPLLQLLAPRKEPLIHLEVPKAETLEEYWTSPGCVLPRIIQKTTSYHYLGEAFPVLFPVSIRIAAITAKYLGAKNLFVDDQTTWSEPFVESWADQGPLVFDETLWWWRKTEELLNSCIEWVSRLGLDCQIGLPDLNGPTEILADIRGAEKLCMDLVFEPQEVSKRFEQVLSVWFEAYDRCSGITSSLGGNFTWMGIHSLLSAIDIQSDFSCLISPEMFEQFILPSMLEQIERIDRSIFHLDGPDMVRHLDSLLRIEGLDAIQWVYGAGGGRASDWIELLRRIQDAGKSVWIECDPDEVPILTRTLSKTGLMMVTKTDTLEEAHSLLRGLE